MTLPETRTLQWQQCHALHCRPNSNNGAKEANNNDPAGGIGCGDHFIGGVGALLGSGAMTMMTTVINDGTCSPQVVITV